ncbi:aldehyde ferredoxin oxidoreductase [Candidatus Bipolaricaulota bacterium]|nr:aldehyde ferredoxin oxidoreductase [Candidatus Bipolaricaulota bacterium]MBS3814430.1 aldehyde ferredoxin oxidoreductase [Candidatus Bipolaricaulota bacterium]MBS3825990.1 aldehyde ferredoxin oxidoreductase [Candidatus Bipolaricaulota bacterium]
MSRKILRIDMESESLKFEDLPEDYKYLGGRGLTSQIVADEVPPDCHPLGPNNKLVFAPGIVTGTSAPTSGRISVGAKSPLTGGIKEANAGTSFSQKLARLGIGAIVVEGKPSGAMYKCLKLDKDGVQLVNVEDLSGIGLYDAFAELRSEYGEGLGVCGAGIAAELSGANSGIAFNDTEGMPSRYAGRGGLGAVMATRGLKFILVDDEGAEGVEIEDEGVFERGRKKLTDALTEHDVTKPGGALNSYGTSVLVNIINEAGALPQKNFSRGSDDRSAKVSGEKKSEEIKKRGGERPHRCSPGCVIGCSEVWTREDGGDPVGVLEYESAWALGPNCEIYDLDTIGELNRQCNDLGMDTIEAGNTIAVAMEGGVKKFGDEDGALELMEEIRNGTPLGKILVNGTEFAGKAFGVTRIPTVKGQAIPAYDPRAIKGIGTTYATTPMGADHTAGYAIAPEIMGVGGEEDPLSPEKAELSRNLQYSTAVIDTTGHCLFTAFAVLDIPEGLEGMVEEVNGVLGTDLTVDDIPEIGKGVIETEREFNKKAGFTRQDDRLPEFMREEELPPHNDVFDVPEEELDRVFGDLG